ncbi:MAG: phage holin family protein [Bifidobacteriaceae bacterium]|jgi:hypothetical protein|nr:phage holin family protein [Bifidobacteriaceae bacterium]
MASKPLAEVVQGTLAQVTDLVKETTALIKAQAGQDGAKVGLGAAMIVVALVCLAGVPPLLILAFVWGLVAAGLPVWASYLIATALMLVLTVVTFLIAKNALSKAVANSKRTMEAVKGTVKALTGSLAEAPGTVADAASPTDTSSTTSSPPTAEG